MDKYSLDMYKFKTLHLKVDVQADTAGNSQRQFKNQLFCVIALPIDLQDINGVNQMLLQPKMGNNHSSSM